ncbi:ABC transporter ATP-binding protein [Hoeflea sp. WL0058]|uniref:ABC transporter ATP-binding protein n=1 Tax=Flavimaribacter sediminis TaxID=2865987 RepID=A0AAE3D0D9_9HYPH|nr:ABC transporter ATP-binding protein [Flavimaribacter sediminis]MBW8637569.1 ABC transporter ATP-binding protein [Flavimaribacter sediminis]
MNTVRLDVENLVKHYQTPHGVVRAVDGVSFSVEAGRTLALVGESGCGKSTVAKAILGLIERDGGHIGLSYASERGRGRRPLGMVFQNPYSSLNPRMRVRDTLAEALYQAGFRDRVTIQGAIESHLADVGMSPQHAERYPHELSGGQRQRVGIARALALDPDILLLDEPTAALDVSVQAQILNLLRDLQESRGLGYLLISHSLATVESIADDVIVMYFGRLVESGPVGSVFGSPAHPYTRALLDAVPPLDPSRRDKLVPLAGSVPSYLSPPPGCPFAPRCSRVVSDCEARRPSLNRIDDRRKAACIRPQHGETAML